jgi:hypothetical protein
MQDMPHLKEMVQSMKVSDCKMQNGKHKFRIIFIWCRFQQITLDNTEMTTNLKIGSNFGKMEVSMMGSLYMI